MNRQFQELRDYLQTAERGFATMRGQGSEVARVGYRAAKMFMNARQMLDQAMADPALNVAPGLVLKSPDLETVPPDPPSPKPKNGRRKRI